jgi:hypothetical protein
MKKLLMLAAVAAGVSATFAGTAQAAVSPWQTVAKGAVSANAGEGIVVGHTVRYTYGLRVKTRAPRGRVWVDTWTNCRYGGESTKSWVYWSSGRYEQNVRRVPFTGYGSRCDVVVSALSLRRGYLTMELQRYRYSD